MAFSAGSPEYPLSAHRCSSMSSGRSMMISSSTSSSWLTSCLLAPVTTIDSGTPRPSVNKWRLLPFFPPIGRVTTNCLERQGCFDQSTIDTLPTPGNTFHLVVFGKPRTPKRYEKTSPHPVHEVSMNRARAAKAFLGQCFPLTACSEYIKYGFKDFSWRNRLSTSASPALISLVQIALRCGYQRFNPFPKSIRDFP